jgi:hypothetical protein
LAALLLPPANGGSTISKRRTEEVVFVEIEAAQLGAHQDKRQPETGSYADPAAGKKDEPMGNHK